mgnify:FL=1
MKTLSTNKIRLLVDNINETNINNTMIYITILNFSNGSVHQLEFTNQENQSSEDMELFIEDQGFELNNIEWMSHTDPKIYK